MRCGAAWPPQLAAGCVAGVLSPRPVNTCCLPPRPLPPTVVVEGGTAPEPAGAEEGEEGEEEPVGQELQQAQQAVSAGGSPGASRRSRRSARSQPSYHTERVVTGG